MKATIKLVFTVEGDVFEREIDVETRDTAFAFRVSVTADAKETFVVPDGGLLQLDVEAERLKA